ncbi:pro-sigmaK processing inhibitor BofA family protein [Thermoactinomyces daqus]|uniref:Pro-sigmaK processing inhibitor BofA family protein n=1 Tax=Thermoactinomyces daqus TaxID=1329516 RepID=A0A7W2AJD9_9BACL|nr:pro-sigmaK processing inhibitor BofA family protein [Thermoactinomyces daqus]MBA4544245.1 pro-sigmaK processing inhibitor BofA family protein [Thermoactinomyces daqus]
MLEAKWWILLAAAGLVFFMAVSRSVKEPFKWIWLGLLYTVMGGIVLFVVNFFGQTFHFHLAINPVTAFITGFLGIPGLLYLAAVKMILL